MGATGASLSAPQLGARAGDRHRRPATSLGRDDAPAKDVLAESSKAVDLQLTAALNVGIRRIMGDETHVLIELSTTKDSCRAPLRITRATHRLSRSLCVATGPGPLLPSRRRGCTRARDRNRPADRRIEAR